MPLGDVTREKATYNWPWKIQGLAGKHQLYLMFGLGFYLSSWHIKHERGIGAV